MSKKDNSEDSISMPPIPSEATPSLEGPAPIAPKRERKKRLAKVVGIPCNESPSIGKPLNGYIILSIKDAKFLNDGVVSSIGEFNPLGLSVGDRVLYGEFASISDYEIAVHFDEVIAKVEGQREESSSISAVDEKWREEEEKGQEEGGIFGDVPFAPTPQSNTFDIDDTPAPPSSLTVEMPEHNPVQQEKNPAVVNKGGSKAEGGIRHLNRPRRR